MTDRIRELRQQALRWSGENVNRNLYTNYEIEHKEYQKFAELIVRECADVATINQFQWDSAGGYVLKHFGVEQ